VVEGNVSYAAIQVHIRNGAVAYSSTFEVSHNRITFAAQGVGAIPTVEPSDGIIIVHEDIELCYGSHYIVDYNVAMLGDVSWGQTGVHAAVLLSGTEASDGSTVSIAHNDVSMGCFDCVGVGLVASTNLVTIGLSSNKVTRRMFANDVMAVPFIDHHLGHRCVGLVCVEHAYALAMPSATSPSPLPNTVTLVGNLIVNINHFNLSAPLVAVSGNAGLLSISGNTIDSLGADNIQQGIFVSLVEDHAESVLQIGDNHIDVGGSGQAIRISAPRSLNHSKNNTSTVYLRSSSILVQSNIIQQGCEADPSQCTAVHFDGLGANVSFTDGSYFNITRNRITLLNTSNETVMLIVARTSFNQSAFSLEKNYFTFDGAIGTIAALSQPTSIPSRYESDGNWYGAYDIVSEPFLRAECNRFQGAAITNYVTSLFKGVIFDEVAPCYPDTASATVSATVHNRTATPSIPFRNHTAPNATTSDPLPDNTTTMGPNTTSTTTYAPNTSSNTTTTTTPNTSMSYHNETTPNSTTTPNTTTPTTTTLNATATTTTTNTTIPPPTTPTPPFNCESTTLVYQFVGGSSGSVENTTDSLTHSSTFNKRTVSDLAKGEVTFEIYADVGASLSALFAANGASGPSSSYRFHVGAGDELQLEGVLALRTSLTHNAVSVSSEGTSVVRVAASFRPVSIDLVRRAMKLNATSDDPPAMAWVRTLRVTVAGAGSNPVTKDLDLVVSMARALFECPFVAPNTSGGAHLDFAAQEAPLSVTVTFSKYVSALPQALRDTAQVTSVISRTGSALVAAPGAAGTVGRSTILVQLVTCEFSDYAPLDLSQSITGLGFGDPKGYYYRGGVVGNFAVIVGAVVFMFGSALVLFAFGAQYRSMGFASGFMTALFRLHFPAFMIVPYMALMPGLVMCTVAALWHGNGDGTDIGIGLFGLLVSLGLPTALIAPIYHNLHCVLFFVARRCAWRS
jgi:hypothetical protein